MPYAMKLNASSGINIMNANAKETAKIANVLKEKKQPHN